MGSYTTSLTSKVKAVQCSAVQCSAVSFRCKPTRSEWLASLNISRSPTGGRVGVEGGGRGRGRGPGGGRGWISGGAGAACVPPCECDSLAFPTCPNKSSITRADLVKDKACAYHFPVGNANAPRLARPSWVNRSRRAARGSNQRGGRTHYAQHKDQCENNHFRRKGSDDPSGRGERAAGNKSEE